MAISSFASRIYVDADSGKRGSEGRICAKTNSITMKVKKAYRSTLEVARLISVYCTIHACIVNIYTYEG